jgi:ribosomal protein S18 acetylase RimI-like enzyme
MSISIRQAKPDELATALSLFEAAAMKLRAKGINQWQHWIDPTPDYVQWVKTGFDNKEYFFIEKADQLAGMFRLMYSDEAYWGKQTDSAAYLHSLVTKTEFEGQSIGSTVLATMTVYLRQKDVKYFRLDCKADNVALCNYYIRQGFVPVRTQAVAHYTVQLFEKKLIE